MCQWTGDPDPDITWYKDGVALNEAELPGHIRITQREEGGVQLSELQILSVEISDAGDYTCNVSNPVGFAYQIKRLEVRSVCMCVRVWVCMCVCECGCVCVSVGVDSMCVV